MSEMQRSENLTQAAAALAYAGALPLVIAAILIWARPADIGPTLVPISIVYGALLLAFFGGIRWGIAVMGQSGPTFGNLLGGVVPLLVAFPVLLLKGTVMPLAIIVVALPLLLFDDLRATKRGSGAPDWYLGVRLPLTIMLGLSFVAILLNQVV